MYFVVFSSKSVFFKLDEVFPECALYREKSPRIEPLVCLQEDNSCTVGKTCMEVLVKRIHVLFEEILQDVEVLILYYKKRNVAGIGAGIFWRNLKDFRIITINPTSWNYIKSRGAVYQFHPSPEFYLGGTSQKPEEAEEENLALE